MKTILLACLALAFSFPLVRAASDPAAPQLLRRTRLAHATFGNTCTASQVRNDAVSTALHTDVSASRRALSIQTGTANARSSTHWLLAS